MPSLDRTGIDHGEVDLAEAFEAFAVTPQHVEDRSPLVGDTAQWRDSQPVDLAHLGPRSSASRWATQNRTVCSIADRSGSADCNPNASRRRLETAFGAAGSPNGSGARRGGFVPVSVSTTSATSSASARTVQGAPEP